MYKMYGFQLKHSLFVFSYEFFTLYGTTNNNNNDYLSIHHNHVETMKLYLINNITKIQNLTISNHKVIINITIIVIFYIFIVCLIFSNNSYQVKKCNQMLLLFI